MIGFLLKLVVIVVIVGGIFSLAYIKFFQNRQGISGFSGLVGQAKSMDLKVLAQNINDQLDKLITHTDRSPVVMGIEITNRSLEAMVDSIQSLPPEQYQLVRQFICQPASPSGR